MTQDELFAEQLRAFVDPVAPAIRVDESTVLSRGRRRRTVRRTFQATAVVGVVAAVGTGVALGIPRWGEGAPAIPAQDPPVTSTSTAEPTASIIAPYGSADFAVSDDDGLVTGVSGDSWDGDELYWHTTTETRDESGSTLRSTEIWHSRERFGVVVIDGDTAGAFGAPPTAVLGSFVVDGVALPLLAEPALLPTDPTALEQLIRATVAANGRDGFGVGNDLDDIDAGKADSSVFQTATDLLTGNGGTLTRDLREALWQVAVAVPGADSRTGTDPDGRTAEIVHFVSEQDPDWEVELFRDPETGLVIATHYPAAAEPWTVITQQGPTSDIPVQPTLEMTGCSAWSACLTQ